jgi:hypothetical protein
MGLLSDSLTILATQFLFFLIGWIFFVKKLFKDYELRHHMVQIIFCVNFTLSCTMFELIIFEISDTLERSSRYFHWYLSLYMTLFMVIIMTPLYLRYVIRLYIIFKNIAIIVNWFWYVYRKYVYITIEYWCKANLSFSYYIVISRVKSIGEFGNR